MRINKIYKSNFNLGNYSVVRGYFPFLPQGKWSQSDCQSNGNNPNRTCSRDIII